MADPTDVRVIVVKVEDVATALEANLRRDAGAVLRVTPPFSGRMRARLHRAGTVEDDESLHVDPADLVDAPPFPTPDDTEDELREAGDYSRERHREYHAERVEAWREAVREGVVEAVEVETSGGHRRVEVRALGS